MRLVSFSVHNFRRLQDVRVSVDKETTIFVGANNSGKTSASRIFSLFLGSGSDHFSIYDFCAQCWQRFDSIPSEAVAGEAAHDIPTIKLDLWFEVEKSDIYRVIDILPNLEWKDTPIGVRLEYAPRNTVELIANFRETCRKAKAKKSTIKDRNGSYSPWPISMTDFLSKQLRAEFRIRYFVLDRSHFDEAYNPKTDCQPMPLGDESGRGGETVLRNLIKVDFLNAQRHLSDDKSLGRAENLSKRLSRFYERNLAKREEDIDATIALADSEAQLNAHFDFVFGSTLTSLSKLGYPGFSNPQLVIKSILNPETILKETAHVHYKLPDDSALGKSLDLPDQYNGLGFKNLIYMVIEVLDFHNQWLEQKDERALLHLVIIEEPEAHLHAQLQQVFIRKIREVVPDEGASALFTRQLIVTTHSPHIIYESGFLPIRYFRRSAQRGIQQTSTVLNLSEFYGKAKKETREFLQCYMKQTHCDLFFADAAILVEGNVERLLLPLMIQKSAKTLQSRYLSILEVGGAFAYVFRELIEFLGQPTLIITDLDSVAVPIKSPAADDDEEENQPAACQTCIAGATSSNLTLTTWLPKITDIDKLLAAKASDKLQHPTVKSPAAVCVTYQTAYEVTWNGEKAQIAGRTLEESFGLENLSWCQDAARKNLGLSLPKKYEKQPIAAVAKKLFERVSGSSFRKTDFALALMTHDVNSWNVPTYIKDGLAWLETQFPSEPEQKAPPPSAPQVVPPPTPIRATAVVAASPVIESPTSQSRE